MSTALATTGNGSLVTKFADRFGVAPEKLLTTLKATCFKTKEPATNEQMMALLIVADQYKLNPFTKEIFAFEDKHKGIVPVVSVDGWARIINEHPEYDGVEFSYSENVTTPKDGKPCPDWCEGRIFRKDRSRPTVVREYLDEVYQPVRSGFNGPWQSHTKRFLRHKTLIQTARIAFGFAGIYDEDEARRIIDGEAIRVQATQGADVADLQKRLQERAQLAHDTASVIEHETPPADMDPATGEVPSGKPEIDSKKLRAALHLAETVDALNEAAADISLLPDGADKDEVTELFDTRRRALEE